MGVGKDGSGLNQNWLSHSGPALFVSDSAVEAGGDSQFKTLTPCSYCRRLSSPLCMAAYPRGLGLLTHARHLPAQITPRQQPWRLQEEEYRGLL